MESLAKKGKNYSPRIIDCGLADYREVLARQCELREKRRRDEIPNTVLVVEHPAVITLGARRSANKLLTDREDLAQRQIDIVDIRRGGGTTAHNPGQLVFYPIVHLQQLGLGISEYIRKLEAIGIELLEQLGVHATRRKGLPGLWVQSEREPTSKDTKDATKSYSAVSATSEVRRQRDTRYAIRNTKKIASVGVRVSKFVTHHGMAINIRNDLSIFDLLIPCGLDDVQMTSVLKETDKRHSMNHIKNELSQLLVTHLSRSVNNEP